MLDNDLSRLFSATVRKRLRIVTGFQTGTDTAAADFALALRLPLSGWCPLGRTAENGTIPAHYPAQETDSPDPAVRTKANAHDSDGTLVIIAGEASKDGTKLTIDFAQALGRPVYCITWSDSTEPDKFWSWIEENSIQTLNVAGPRQSTGSSEGIDVYSVSRAILEQLFIASK